MLKSIPDISQGGKQVAMVECFDNGLIMVSVNEWSRCFWRFCRQSDLWVSLG